MVAVSPNAQIAAIKNNYMTDNAIGLWYVKIPNNDVINPLGEVVEPKGHNGSIFVLIDRKRVAVSKLPKLDNKSIEKFKEVFV